MPGERRWRADPRDGWQYAIKERICLYWDESGAGWQAFALVWGSGGRISFVQVGSDCPVRSFPLRQRYWTSAYLYELEEPCMQYLKKLAEAAKKRRVQLSDQEKKVNEALAAIREYCETAVWPNGDARSTSTLSLFTDDGVWKACLNDKAEDQVLFATGDSIWGVLEALEATLRAGTGDWRRSKWSSSGKAQKRPSGGVDRRG